MTLKTLSSPPIPHKSENNAELGKLLQIVEKLHEQSEEGATRSAILISLNELNTFAQRHFEAQEKYLASINAPELKTRKSQNHKLLSQLADHTEKFKSSASAIISSRFYEFIQIWLSIQLPLFINDSEVSESKSA